MRQPRLKPDYQDTWHHAYTPGNRRVESAAAVAERLWRPRESAEAVVAKKRSNARGAKGRTEE